MKRYKFWFIAGSQHLYGGDVLRTVESRGAEMAGFFDAELPCGVVFKGTMKTPDDISNCVREANHDQSCAGIIAWMHTFSPSKMWINGLVNLQKPYCHLHTQYNRSIPDSDIDMDFMNLNQSAHGDREHGFINTRLRLARKIVVGYWKDGTVLNGLSSWMRSAVGAAVSRGLKVVRFGDNMRQVAVTEGDKVEAQAKLGWQVNTQPVGRLAEEIAAVTDGEAEALLNAHREKYVFALKDDQYDAALYQTKEEIAIGRILDEQGAEAFTNTFEDLYGMEQLPGLAAQRLMERGIGFGAEGDWKTAAMTRIVKAMTSGMPGGTSFIEDYTYDLEQGRELSLGAHMLEVCPSIAAEKPRIEVHNLSIGDRRPPARLVFEGCPGKAVLASLIDMGGRFRLIIADIEVVKPIYKMPNLPVARVMWRAEPDFVTASQAWIMAGGAHHSVLSYDATPEMLTDWADIMGVETVRISAKTDIETFKRDLFLADIAYKLC
ncbi:MAG: L-arabinose isomerase [Clostridiales bacterium]|jgi:L-arabinose isomerase|nr:L-arabinose isomerase [Clostridiales bacterium]